MTETPPPARPRFSSPLRLGVALCLLAAALTGCVCFKLHLVGGDPVKRSIVEFKCRLSRLQEKYLDQLDAVQCCDLASINATMAEGGKVLELMARLNRDMAAQHNKTRLELRAYFHALLVSSKLHVYAEPERGMFETSQEYQARLKAYRAKRKQANQTSSMAVSWVERQRDERLTQLSIEAAKWRIKMLRPFVECLTGLQKQRFLLPRLPVQVTVHKPEPDKNRFPLDIKTCGRRWTRYWSYSGESDGWTFWKTRSQVTARAWVQMAARNQTAGWAPTRVEVATPSPTKRNASAWTRPRTSRWCGTFAPRPRARWPICVSASASAGSRSATWSPSPACSSSGRKADASGWAAGTGTRTAG
jgi:hypothetical protein